MVSSALRGANHLGKPCADVQNARWALFGREDVQGTTDSGKSDHLIRDRGATKNWSYVAISVSASITSGTNRMTCRFHRRTGSSAPMRVCRGRRTDGPRTDPVSERPAPASQAHRGPAHVGVALSQMRFHTCRNERHGAVSSRAACVRTASGPQLPEVAACSSSANATAVGSSVGSTRSRRRSATFVPSARTTAAPCSRNVSNSPAILPATKEPDMPRYCTPSRPCKVRTLTHQKTMAR
jgi:hypothetical protein